MSRTRLIPVLAAAFALAGCGGDGEDGGAELGGVDTDSTVYQAAFGICSSASPEEIKNDYRTKSAKPEDIIAAVTLTLAGGNPDDEAVASAGCKDGLEAYEGG